MQPLGFVCKMFWIRFSVSDACVVPGEKKNKRAKQTSLHRVVPSRHKADSAAHSDLSSVCHRLHLTISRASGQENKTKQKNHTQKKPHHQNMCFIPSPSYFCIFGWWIWNYTCLILNIRCHRYLSRRIKCKMKTPQITERTEEMHAYFTLQKEEQLWLAFSLVLPPWKIVF